MAKEKHYILSRREKEGSNRKANATVDINAVNIPSVSDNLICSGSKLQENMEYVSREDNEVQNYEVEANGEHKYWEWFKKQYRWNDIFKE